MGSISSHDSSSDMLEVSLSSMLEVSGDDKQESVQSKSILNQNG